MKFKVGQRVRTTVDALGLSHVGFTAAAGTGAVVRNAYPISGGRDVYSVLLDGDPTGLAAAYNESELEEES